MKSHETLFQLGFRRTRRKTLRRPIDVFPTRRERRRESRFADAVKRRQDAEFGGAIFHRPTIRFHRNKDFARLILKRSFGNRRKRILREVIPIFRPRINTRRRFQNSSARRLGKVLVEFQFQRDNVRRKAETLLYKNRDATKLVGNISFSLDRRWFRRRTFRLHIQLDQLADRNVFVGSDESRAPKTFAQLAPTTNFPSRSSIAPFSASTASSTESNVSS